MPRRRTYCNGKVVTSCKFGDFPNVPERGTHDNGLVVVLLVVIEDLANAVHTRVLGALVVLLGRSLVPVENAADER